MKTSKIDRSALRARLERALSASLGALALAVPGHVAAADPSSAMDASAAPKKHGCPTLAFTSTRAVEPDPALPPLPDDAFRRAEIFLMDLDPAAVSPNPHGTNVRRLTENEHADAFANLSPDGTGRIVFDSNRLRGSGWLNTSDLFLMNKKGKGQKFLVHGGSPSWSPDGNSTAFHRSASSTGPGTGREPIKGDPGAATADSDIFVAKVDHRVHAKAGSDDEPAVRNLTHTPEYIEDDPDWSPDGKWIAYTRHNAQGPHDDSADAEIYVIDAKGKLEPKQLTYNDEEDRAPAWSLDGSHIAYMCRQGPVNPTTGFKSFEICVMPADGSAAPRRLTVNPRPDTSPAWLPSELVQGILTHRLVIGRGVAGGAQRLVMLSFNDATADTEEQMLDIDWTGQPGPFAPWTDLFPKYGVIQGKCK